MNEMTLDQSDTEFFTYEVSDEALETAGACLEAKSKHLYSVDVYSRVFLPWALALSGDCESGQNRRSYLLTILRGISCS